MAQSSFNQGANMTAGSKGGYPGPNTRAPGGGGMDYNGNPVGGGMGAQFNFGGPAPMPQPGGNRFMPGGGMVPPAGAGPQPGQPTGPYTRQRAPAGDPRRYGNPRQVNPGQGPMQPGQSQPNPRDIMQKGVIDPIFGGIARGIGGGKGGFGGPGRPVFGPAPLPPTQPIYDDGFGRPGDVNVGEVNYPGY